jgi:hypothetical protein
VRIRAHHPPRPFWTLTGVVEAWRDLVRVFTSTVTRTRSRIAPAPPGPVAQRGTPALDQRPARLEHGDGRRGRVNGSIEDGERRELIPDRGWWPGGAAFASWAANCALRANPSQDHPDIRRGIQAAGHVPARCYQRSVLRTSGSTAGGSNPGPRGSTPSSRRSCSWTGRMCSTRCSSLSTYPADVVMRSRSRSPF